MRESFVFHAEYIEDLPDEYKARFIEYTVNYGLTGKSPEIEDDTLESTVWKKIARRIDSESEKYRITSERRKEAALKRYAKYYGEQPKEEKQAPAPAESEEKPKEKKTFKKPTVEEIAAYCAERKNSVDAQAFYDFYESKGWKVGAVKMSDWRASVRTWEKRDASEKRARSKTIWNDGTTDADTSEYESIF